MEKEGGRDLLNSSTSSGKQWSLSVDKVDEGLACGKYGIRTL